ncbi:MAG: acyl carrier protein [Magnetococcales bacterium]|nr:acyl carrier protein [Magnetococcales bacterium]
MDPRRFEVMQRLNLVFQEVFDDETLQICDTTTAKDIEEWDSLEHISLIIATEMEFGVRLNAAEVGRLHDVGAMIDLLLERLPA